MDPEIDLGVDDWHMWPFCILVICVNSWLNAQFCTHSISLPDREENLNMIFNSWKPANPKGNQPWIFIGKTDAEAPILWPTDVKSWLIIKDTDAVKDRGQEKGATEDEMVGWWLNGHEGMKVLHPHSTPLCTLTHVSLLFHCFWVASFVINH